MLTAGLATTSDAHAEGWYLSLFGGVNWLEESSDNITAVRTSTAGPTTFTFAGAVGVDPELGWVVGAAAGGEIMPSLRGELEFAFRRNSGDLPFSGSYTIATPGSTIATAVAGDGDFEADTYSLMANVWYEIPTEFEVRPYVGGGVGWGWVNANLDAEIAVTAPTTFTAQLFEDDDTQNGFAYQLGAGLAMDFSNSLSGFVEYRYLEVTDISFGAGANEFDADWRNHVVQFGVRIPMK
jgi:opacity protein-like surface antigen